MVDTYSSTKNRVRNQTEGGNSNSWGQILDDNLERLDRAASGYLAKAITGNTTLTETEAQYKHLKLTGTLSAAATVTIPGYSGEYIVTNATSGGYAVTVKAAAGSGVSITNGTRRALFCDGTDTYVISQALQADQNLSDLDDEATARTNLGLGALAVLNSVAADQIDAGAVGTSELAARAATFAKVQAIATARILGRTTAMSGDIEELAVDTAHLTLSSGSLALSTGTGGALLKTGGTMGGAIIGTGTGGAATGYQIQGGTDIGSLFLREIAIATSGSGNGLANVSWSSIVNGTATMTKTFTTFATPGGGGGS